MKQGIYTILDRVAGVNAVVQMPSDEVAMRYFKTAFRNPNAGFDKNASDYVGCKLGDIDTETGAIESNYVEMLDCYDFLLSEGKKDERREEKQN